MRLLFLIPFATAVITSYLFQKTTQEIAYLTGTIAIVSLILSLLMAPWQVQLIIVIVAVIIARQNWRQLQETEKFEEVVKLEQVRTTSEEKDINKDSSVNDKFFPITANVTLGVIEGKYRGSPLPCQKLSQKFVVYRQSKLKYRGVDISPEQFLFEQKNMETNSTNKTKDF